MNSILVGIRVIAATTRLRSLLLAHLASVGCS